jgi:hypothetical protein
VQGPFAGSIGVIEECFSAELVADSSDRARRASVITPARIAGLPLEQRQELFSALIARREQLVAHGEQSVEDYRRALQSEPGGTRPRCFSTARLLADTGRWSMVFAWSPTSAGSWSTIHCSQALFWGMLRTNTSMRFWPGWPRFAPHRGGYITFFPPELAEGLREADAAIAKESAQRTAEKRREVEEIALSELGRVS